jgi:ParB family chromosome partitioning protein
VAPKTSVSSLLPGLVEDLDIFRIQQSNRLLRHPYNIDELADSIRKNGLLQPIIVRTKTKSQEIFFEIVAGNRRYLACKSLGWRKITCHILELDDRGAFEISLVENLQRKMLSPIEEAQAFKTYVTDYGWGGVSVLSSRIGKSISYITKRMKLLDLPPDILESITNSSISVSSAEELYTIKDPSMQSELSVLISNRNLSLRKVRQLVKETDENILSKAVLEEEDPFFPTTNFNGSSEDAQRAFDKSVITLKVALNRLGKIIDEHSDSFILRETLMHHKNILNQQIDMLLKEKKKAQKRQIG